MRLSIVKTIVVVALCAAGAAQAGPYSDDLGRCLVSATSAQDKADLVRWIFSNAALHPNVADISSVSPPQRDQLNRVAAALVQRLLTADCRKQTQEAAKYEGGIAFQLAFQLLGQVAMQEMMSNPAVGGAFGEFAKYMDEKKLREVGLGQSR